MHNLKDVILHLLKGTDVDIDSFVQASINHDLRAMPAHPNDTEDHIIDGDDEESLDDGGGLEDDIDSGIKVGFFFGGANIYIFFVYRGYRHQQGWFDDRIQMSEHLMHTWKRGE